MARYLIDRMNDILGKEYENEQIRKRTADDFIS